MSDVIERGAEAIRQAIPSDRNLPGAQDYHRLAFEAAARMLLEELWKLDPATLSTVNDRVSPAYAQRIWRDMLKARVQFLGLEPDQADRD